jgi:hypothetical protein
MDEQKIGVEQYKNFFGTVRRHLEGFPYSVEMEYIPPVDNLPARLKVIPATPKDIDNIATLITGVNLPVYVDKRISYLFLDLDEEAFFQYRAAALNHTVVEEEHVTTTVTSVKRRTSDLKASFFSLSGMAPYKANLITSEQKTFRAFMCMLKFGDLAVEAGEGHLQAIKVKGFIDRLIQFMYGLDEFKIEYLYHEDTLGRVGENYLSILLEDKLDYTTHISVEMREAVDPIKLIRTPIDYRELTLEGKKRILIGYTPNELLTTVIKEVGLVFLPDERQQGIIDNLSKGTLVLVDPKDPFTLEEGTVKPKKVSL